MGVGWRSVYVICDAGLSEKKLRRFSELFIAVKKRFHNGTLVDVAGLPPDRIFYLCPDANTTEHLAMHTSVSGFARILGVQ